MSSAKNVFEESVKNTVNSFFSAYSHQLSDWVREHKDVEISPEEFCAALDVPFRAPLTPGLTGSNVQTQMPTLPNYYSGTGVSPAKKKGGRSKKVIDPNTPICVYVMTRGKNPGKRCTNPVLGDGSLGADSYCKGCLKKTTVKNSLQGATAKSTVQPPTIPGSVVEIPKQPKEKNDGELQVVAFGDESEGFFREVNHGFIVQQSQNGDIVAHSIDDNGTLRDLREDERKIALNLGLQVKHEELPSVPQVPPNPAVAVPQVPQVPLVNLQVPNS